MIDKALLFSLLATPVVASCPVGADLKTGIQLTQADGTTEVFRDLGNSVVQVTSTYPDDYVSQTLLGQGVYVLELIDLIDGEVDPDTRMTFAFPMNPPNLPQPTAGELWTVKTVGRDIDGTFPETLTMQWGEVAEVNYGSCAYTMIPGTLTYQGEDYGHVEVIHYLPDVKIGVLHSYEDDEMAAQELFPVVEISKVKG